MLLFFGEFLMDELGPPKFLLHLRWLHIYNYVRAISEMNSLL